MADKNLDVSHLEPTSNVVDPSPTVTPAPIVSADPIVPPVVPDPVPGSRTPEPNLKAALDEERRLRKEATERNRELENQLSTFKNAVPSGNEDEILSDEGKALKTQLDSVSNELKSIKEEKEFGIVASQYPALVDLETEFKEFRANSFPGASIVSVAKLFLADRDLLTKPRKGLEPARGGQRQNVNPKISVSEAEDLMKNNFRLYQRMVMDGRIKPEDFK